LSRYKGYGRRAFGTDKRISFVDDFARNKIAPGKYKFSFKYKIKIKIRIIKFVYS
jgi:hypothetical protein